MPASLQEKLLLLPYTQAIELLKGKDVTVEVVTPPYTAIGRGGLRVIKATENEGGVHLALSYEDYDRLP